MIESKYRSSWPPPEGRPCRLEQLLLTFQHRAIGRVFILVVALSARMSSIHDFSALQSNGKPLPLKLLDAVLDIDREWYAEPGQRQRFLDRMARDGRVVDFLSQVHRHKTRERIWIRENARVVRDANGEPLFHPDFQVSINKSPVQFHDDAGRQLGWGEHLAAIGLPGTGIVIGITEGLLLDTTARRSPSSCCHCATPASRCRWTTSAPAIRR
jgi:hypothetical protein